MRSKTETNGAASATPAATTAATASAKPSDTPKTELTGTVTASGSSALLPLVKQAAQEFMDKNPKVTIQVTAGGSGTGIKT